MLLLYLTRAAAMFTFAGPVDRGPGRELGATMAVSAPGPGTVIYRTQTFLGDKFTDSVEEDIIAELDSESAWQMFVGAGDRLYVMRDDNGPLGKRVVVEQILSREAALRAAAAAEETGTYLYLAGSTLLEEELLRGGREC